MADKIPPSGEQLGYPGAKPQPGQQPAAKPAPVPPPTTDPKILLLEEIAAAAVASGKRDDPLTIRLQALITEMKGGPKPAPEPQQTKAP